MSVEHEKPVAGGLPPGADPYRVESYPPPHEDPLCYPGLRPDFAFTTTADGAVLPVAVHETEQGVRFEVDRQGASIDLDAMLQEHAVPLMADRVPVVGFGSNACPGQLMQKFTHKYSAAIPDVADQRIVPTLTGKVKDFAAVYSSKLGIWSYVFAELHAQTGVETDVYVNFLSPNQLAAMERSEGAYHLCKLGTVAIDGLRDPLPAYGFAGKNQVMLHPGEEPQGALADLDHASPRHRQPILLEAVATTGDQAPHMSEVELLNHLAQTIGGRLRALYPHMPAEAEQLNSSELTSLQRASLLVRLNRQRAAFVRRFSTEKTTYAHPPEDGEVPDRLFSEAIVHLLRMDRLIATTNVLQSLPSESVNVTPQTFGELYAK